MSDHSVFDMRTGLGPLPESLRVPLADLLDALAMWEWVGEDTVMDGFTNARNALHDAHKAMRDAVRELPTPTAVRLGSEAQALIVDSIVGPLPESEWLERVNALPEGSIDLRGVFDKADPRTVVGIQVDATEYTVTPIYEIDSDG